MNATRPSKWSAIVSCALGAALFTTSTVSAQYSTEISRWQTQDLIDPVPTGSVLFVGSSSVRRWEQLTRDFNDYKVLQRGLGGALITDIVARELDIVLAYRPRAVVLWAGTNDLAAGATGNSVASSYQVFANNILATQPNVDVFYLGIMPTPGRQSNRSQEDIANAQISTFSQTNSRLHYIDLPAAFAPLNPYSGSAFTSKFVDSIHLNRSGYDLWTSVIRPQISAVVAPNKTYTPNANTIAPGEKLLFDFGPSDGTNGDATNTDANGNKWNNWFSVNGGATILPGEHKANLITTAGRNTAVRLTMTAQYLCNGKQNGGLLAPNAALLGNFAVATATEDYFYSTGNNINDATDDDTAGGFMLDGLNPSLTYNFRVFGARQHADAHHRVQDHGREHRHHHAHHVRRRHRRGRREHQQQHDRRPERRPPRCVRTGVFRSDAHRGRLCLLERAGDHRRAGADDARFAGHVRPATHPPRTSSLKPQLCQRSPKPRVKAMNGRFSHAHDEQMGGPGGDRRSFHFYYHPGRRLGGREAGAGECPVVAVGRRTPRRRRQKGADHANRGPTGRSRRPRQAEAGSGHGRASSEAGSRGFGSHAQTGEGGAGGSQGGPRGGAQGRRRRRPCSGRCGP
ncbi:MAG: GDSL-type esterase/lipase family protein [Tepidisphaeraceae bacterium]